MFGWIIILITLYLVVYLLKLISPSITTSLSPLPIVSVPVPNSSCPAVVPSVSSHSATPHSHIHLYTCSQIPSNQLLSTVNTLLSLSLISLPNHLFLLCFNGPSFLLRTISRVYLCCCLTCLPVFL